MHVGKVINLLLLLIQQAEVPEDSDDDDPDEVFGFITMLNLTERKVDSQKVLIWFLLAVEW